MAENSNSKSSSPLTVVRGAPERRASVYSNLFNIIAFDWDGTAVVDRRVDAAPVRSLIERLLKLGVRIVVITGTNFNNVDKQLSAHISGPHKQNLFVLTNRGSEVYRFNANSEPEVAYRRDATPEENEKLDKVAETVRDVVEQETGLEIGIVYDRLNRRKIDLIPLEEWVDPPKSIIGDLLEAVEARLKGAGIRNGIREVFELTKRVASEAGLRDARITSDVKHIEVGLTDKSDSINWLVNDLARGIGVPLDEILIAGDEFGPIGGFEGSDYRMVTPAARGAVFVSVGLEPNGVPPEVIHLGGGPPEFRAILEQQIVLHERAKEIHQPLATSARPLLPLSDDPTWLLREEGWNRAREHEIESIFSISNGYLGTRGLIAEGTSVSQPATFIAGIFDTLPPTADIPELVEAPEWQRFRLVVHGYDISVESGEVLEHMRTLDMRQAVLSRIWRHRDQQGRVTRIEGLRFASLADRHLAGQFVRIAPENYSGRVEMWMMMDAETQNVSGAMHLQVARTEATPVEQCLLVKTKGKGTEIALASAAVVEEGQTALTEQKGYASDYWVGVRSEWHVEVGNQYGADKVVAVFTSRDVPEPCEAASGHLQSTLQRNTEDVLLAHINAWADRWDDADIEIIGDDHAQRGVRFALYHLIGAANPDDEHVSLGARFLTGESYKGHVFWDTEIFMVPFYTFCYPEAARAMLMYRYNTLPGARAKAASLGYKGALYAWESADTGEEVTPTHVIAPTGEVIPVMSGLQEHHIAADVAYAAVEYWEATGDDQFYLDAGAEIVIDTARFWVSRSTLGDDGAYHILKVVGPDEYHENIDDNAFTNLMAQWNIRKAVWTIDFLKDKHPDTWAALRDKLELTEVEYSEWSTVADRLYIGYDPNTEVFEQFRGYYDLEYVDLQAYEPRTVPMDVILGHERILQTQVVKQADVILGLYLLWNDFPLDVHEANFHFYEPRTGHGSSLSPATHALVAARLGDLPLAEHYYREAMEIDLANNMGNASGGVHAAALGGLWQATVFGFGGMEMDEEGLWFDPRIPDSWELLRFPVTWRGSRVRLTVRKDPRAAEVILEQGDPIMVGLVGSTRHKLEIGRRYQASFVDGSWRPWEEVRE